MGSEEGVEVSGGRAGGVSAWRGVLHARLPVLAWARRYDRLAALADLVAGVTLGLTLVPQSIAYAALADLPVHYGLYSSIIGTVLYVFLGTVKEVSIGPTSLMALLTLQTCRGLPIEYVVLLTFLSGCIVLLMGILRLGFLVSLISPSVTSGFTSATSVIIVAAQVKGLLGLSFVAESVLENAQLIVAKWHQVRLPDCALGAVCCITLLLLRKLKDVKVHPKRVTLQKTLWLISISRNALVVFFSSLFAFCIHNPDKPLFKLSGRVEPGFPPLSLPPFSVTHGNQTVNFAGMVHELGSGVIMLPIVMVLANIAIAKAFSEGGRVDATQEMVTLGLCNMAGSLLHAMPTCGAFTRSAVSHSSGVRTPAAGIYSGIITTLALVFLTEYFYFIPKATLSSVLICAVIFMIEVRTVPRLWRRSRGEVCVVAATFLVSVCWTVELGVLAGALAALFSLASHVLCPHTDTVLLKTAYGEVVAVRPTLGLVYLNCERLAARVQHAAAQAHPAHVLVDCAQLSMIDFAATETLERLSKKLKEEGQKLILYNAPSQIQQQLEAAEHLERRALACDTAAEALLASLPRTHLVEETALLAGDDGQDNV